MTKSNVKINADSGFKIIYRAELGILQLEKISNYENMSIMSNTLVKQIKTSSIILDNDFEINFSNLVGADGSNSIVRKYLNLETKVTMGFQYLLGDKTQNYINFTFDVKTMDFGYLWIFPHLNGISVGIYFDSKIVSVKQAKFLLNNFLKENNISLLSTSNLQTAPISYHYSGFKFKNIYLVGEAAGLTSYFSGEGTPNAIISGEQIGKILMDSSFNFTKLKKIIELKNYECDFFI